MFDNTPVYLFKVIEVYLIQLKFYGHALSIKCIDKNKRRQNRQRYNKIKRVKMLTIPIR